MKKLIRSIAISAVIAALPGLAVAGVSPRTTIEHVQVSKNNNAAVVIIANPVPGSNCATTKNRMIISLGSAIGRAQLATALTAVNAGKPVRLVGTDGCIGNIEELNVIILFDE